MRAAYPDLAQHVARDGVHLGYEVFGDGKPTILLMPTWTIVHDRIWKMQVPYLSRHYRVVTYDGPGNGRSDRVTDCARYTLDSYAADAAAVLDAVGDQTAVIAGVSMGAAYALRFASRFPERVRGLILIAPALPSAPPHPDRVSIPDEMYLPYPENPEGWQKYNIAYWYDHYQDFLEFFFGQVFTEPHSTKAREDAVGWGLETGPAVLDAEDRRSDWERVDDDPLRDVTRPTLVIHGTDDKVISHAVGAEAARTSEGTLLSLVGSGHMPNLRDPVRVNRAIHEFVRGLER